MAVPHIVESNDRDTHLSFGIYQSISDKQGQDVFRQKTSLRKPRKKYIMFFVIAILLAVVFFLSFCFGRYELSISSVIRSILNGIYHGIWYIGKFFGNVEREPEWLSSSEDTVVWLVRMPRIFAAMLIGGALAFSGATYQGLFRNPMVSPDILGASSGASVGACLMMLFSQNGVAIQTAAFLMGIVAVALSYTISKSIGRNSNTMLILVLCGMTVNALFQAFVSIIKYLADPESQLPEMTYWLMGSIAKVDYHDLRLFVVVFVAGIIPVYMLRWRINILSLGDDEAKSMGVDVVRIRLVCIICSTLLTASVVSFAGTIGWVGLMIPHLVRFVVGSDNRILLPLSMLTGALFMLVIDDLCRTLFPYEIPLGVLTSLLGAPFFVYILYKRKDVAQ